MKQGGHKQIQHDQGSYLNPSDSNNSSKQHIDNLKVPTQKDTSGSEFSFKKTVKMKNIVDNNSTGRVETFSFKKADTLMPKICEL